MDASGLIGVNPIRQFLAANGLLPVNPAATANPGVRGSSRFGLAIGEPARDSELFS
jgi:hypothetical protein